MSKSETRDNILSSAMELFATKGYAYTTTKLIAEKANCNEATIYRHFITKENLFSQSIKYYTDKFDVTNKIPELSQMEPDDVIRFIGRDFIKHCYINELPYKMQMKIHDDSKDIEKLQLTKRYITALTTYLTILKARGKFDAEPEESATTFIVGILGIFTFYVFLDEVTADYVNRLVDKIICDFINLYNFDVHN